MPLSFFEKVALHVNEFITFNAVLLCINACKQPDAPELVT